MNLESTKSVALRFNQFTLRWLTMALFFVNFLLLFFPWQRVLVPSMLITGKAPAAPLKDVVLIVGFPASLNERAPAGDLKLDAVRKAAAAFIDGVPPQMRLALVLYGHKRGSECNAEIVRKLTALDGTARGDLKKLVANVNPVGLSPLADSLRLAGEELTSNEAGGGIVVIADGVDTCEGDPLGKVNSLSKSLQLSYGVNVLGFAAIPKDLRPLRNIAQAGKGKFFDAQTSAELDEAVTAILKETRTTVENDFIASSLTNTNQSGWSMGFGADPVSGAFLAMIYCLTVTLGMLGGIGLLVVNFVPQVKKFGERLSPVFSLALIAVGAVALLTLGLQMMLGFPIESEFSRHAFTYRSSWLMLAFLTTLLALLSSLFLFWIERKPDRHVPQVRVEW